MPEDVRPRLGRELVDELPVAGLVHEVPRGRDTRLTGGPELGGRRGSDHVIHVGVIHHQHGCMPAQLQHGADQLRCRLHGQGLSDGRRTGERQSLDRRGRGQLFRHRPRITEDQIHHSGRKARVHQYFDDESSRGRSELRRLEHHRAAGRESGAELARRQDRREVPGRDDRDRAERSRDRRTPRTRDHTREHSGPDPARLLAVPPQRLDSAADLAPRVGLRLTGLQQDRRRGLLGTIRQQTCRTAEDVPASTSRQTGPRWERALGSRDRLGNLVGGGQRDGTDRPTVAWVNVVEHPGLARRPGPVDEKIRTHAGQTRVNGHTTLRSRRSSYPWRASPDRSPGTR